MGCGGRHSEAVGLILSVHIFAWWVPHEVSKNVLLVPIRGLGVELECQRKFCVRFDSNTDSSLAVVLSLPTTGAVKVVGVGYIWESVVAVRNAGRYLYVYISRYFATFGM